MTLRDALAAALLLPLASCAVAGDDPEGHRAPIVGGQVSTAAPATGALTLFGSTHCTATVIAPRKLVTAAHCLEGFSAGAMHFVLGPRVSAPERVFEVASIHPHPAFDSSLNNDIGYVLLSEDVPVAPIPVATMDESWVGRELLFVGYGVDDGFAQSGAGTKRAVRMQVSEVGATQFAYADPGKNTCQGDSGGPAFVVDAGGGLAIAGVTSYGDRGCVEFGVDTRVDVYADFLGTEQGGDEPEPQVDPCGGETFEGRCDGDTVVWCEDEDVKTLACPAGCALDPAKGYYDCVQ